MQRKIFYFLLILAICPVLLTAGTKGRIKGKVTDLQTGEALVGANIVVVGTQSGANSDANGEYLISNLDPGVYTLKASYVGYQTITISRVRVNADLTAYYNIEMPSEDIQVGTVDIVAQRPLIQKDNTNAVRITTSEDIENLPVRGVNNIIALTAGVILQNGTLYIRGGRSDEVGYYLEGISVTNPVSGGRSVSISQDALEEIQVQAGGYTAEFGGANAGIVRQQLKSGGPQLKASLEYITDNITFSGKQGFGDGKQRLGAYWWGYNEASAVLSGPLFDQRIKFFANLNYTSNRDSDPRWNKPGFDFGYLGDSATRDTVLISIPAGPVPGSLAERYTLNGTLTFDLKPVMVRVSGTYSDYTGVNGSFYSYLNPRKGNTLASDGTVALKVTHVLSPNMYYEISGGYTFNKTTGYDEALKENYWAYGDSIANAEVGWPTPRNRYIEVNKLVSQSAADVSRYKVPTSYNIWGFTFPQYGTIVQGYSLGEQSNLTFSGKLSLLLGKVHSIQLGGDYQSYTLRSWGVGGQTQLAGSFANQIKDPKGRTEEQIRRQILITSGVNNYGYDVYGNKTDADGFDAPHKPVFASAYITDRIEFEDLIINAGLRYDYFDIDNLGLVDPAYPDAGIDPSTGELKAEGWAKVASFSAVSPRLGFSFPITNTTVFHAQFGKFVQQPQLSTTYKGYYGLGADIKGGFFVTGTANPNIRPTRTTQYEIGFTEQLTDFLSFDITGYYRDIKDNVIFSVQPTAKNSAFQSYTTLANGDFATTKGLELSLNMRRYQRIAVNANLSFQDARGTGSFVGSNSGVVGAPLDGVTIFYPAYISPLSYNNALRGNVNVDYRFGDNDGGPVLQNLGVAALVRFNSGHPFTRGYGAAREAESDSRFRQPVEPLNASLTPATFQVDLTIDKTFKLLDKINLSVYVFVINVFNTKNQENAFLRTGTGDDDGFLSDPEQMAKYAATYGEQYAALYKALRIDYQGGYGGTSVNGGGNLYGPQRQIRLGVRLEY